MQRQARPSVPITCLLVALIAPRATSAPIPTELAEKYFAEMDAISRRDDGKLWGSPLYGPMMFVDAATHDTVGNQPRCPAAAAQERRRLCRKVACRCHHRNTATDWARVKWTMVRWPLPKDATSAPGSWPTNAGIAFRTRSVCRGQPTCAHLDTLEGRYWLQLMARVVQGACRRG